MQCLSVFDPADAAALEASGDSTLCRFHAGTFCNLRTSRFAVRQQRSRCCSNSGCAFAATSRGEADAHAQVCPLAQLECRFSCGELILRAHEPAHVAVCPCAPLECPNSCGKRPRRLSFASHMATCPRGHVDCENASLGCVVRPPREEACHLHVNFCRCVRHLDVNLDVDVT